MALPNPINEPNYPAGAQGIPGTDNPGDDITIPGGPSDVSADETGGPYTQVLYPPVLDGLAKNASDTTLQPGEEAVQDDDARYSLGVGTEPAGGVTVDSGGVRVSGQDEVVNAMATTSGVTPGEFPFSPM